eukprot:COSAG06_NODE_2323_length_7085_cov_7.644718_3_plen_124_part_00
MYFDKYSRILYFDAILCSSFWAVDRRTEFDAVTPSIMARRRAAPRRRHVDAPSVAGRPRLRRLLGAIMPPAAAAAKRRRTVSATGGATDADWPLSAEERDTKPPAGCTFEARSARQRPTGAAS